jgi:DUF4097 and DUF4098 domain-containing protein YvlB
LIFQFQTIYQKQHTLGIARTEEELDNGGSLSVTLLANAQFAVDAVTSNGNITSDFAVSGGSRSDTQLRGTVGSDPGTTLGLRTSNGPIEIRQSR